VCELLVRFLFLIQGLRENLIGFHIPELLGMCPGSPIRSDLVVLHALCRADQRCLLGLRFHVALNDFFAFLEQASHAGAGFPTGLDFQVAADFFDPLYMGLGLFQMFFE
jgi:hypothetical protein